MANPTQAQGPRGWNPLDYASDPLSYFKKSQAAAEAPAQPAAQTPEDATAVSVDATLVQPDQTVAPVATPAQTPEEAKAAADATSKAAVQQAKNDLFLTASNKVYKEWVEHYVYNIPMKIVGLAYYAWTKLTAKDDASVNELNAKLSAFVDATAQRSLLPHERARTNVEAVVFNQERPQAEQAAKNRKANEAEIAFYEAFKARCKVLDVNLNNNNFGIYAHAALSAVEEKMESTAKTGRLSDGTFCDNLELRDILFSTIASNFSLRVYPDMISAYADRPLASMTPESLEQEAEEIHNFCNWVPLEDITDYICKVTGQKRGDELAQLAQECKKDGKTTMVEQTSDALKAKYEAELKAGIAKFKALFGKQGLVQQHFDKTLEPAAKALKEASEKFDAAFEVAFPNYGQPSSTAQRAQLKFNDPAVKAAHAVFKQKQAAHKIALEGYDKLRKEMLTLVQMDNARFDNVTRPASGTSGKLRRLERKLESDNLYAAARKTVDDKGAFYASLAQGLVPEETEEFMALKPDYVPLVDMDFEGE